MATITTDTFLDDGTARTAGESFTINGGKLTIRTDTRWHSNSPASMSGTIGQIAFSTTLGGSLMIDARNVRWAAFNSGSGTVPAIGTVVTEGTVSGYLLGVWETLTSAPTAVDASMPSTGYLKFREITGGTFSVGGSVTGIGAILQETPGSSGGADAPGWIEVVFDQGTIQGLSGSPLSMLQTRGSWYYLGTTSGVANQSVQLPSNGGGSSTNAYSLQIETSPGSDVYEWYNLLLPTTFLNVAISTDKRAKFICNGSEGIAYIGGNGTTVIGFTPAAGCKIRVPNIFQRQCTTAARATNALNATLTSRPRFNTGWNIDFENLSSDSYITVSSGDNFKLKDSSFESVITIAYQYGTTIFSNVANSYLLTSTSYVPMTIQYMQSPQTYENLKIVTPGSSATPFVMSNSSNAVITDSIFARVFNRTSSTYIVNLSICSNITFERTKLQGGSLYFNTCTLSSAKNTDYIDRLSGNTTSSGTTTIFKIVGGADITVDGLTFGLGGELDNCHPYGALISTNHSLRTKFRNVGSRLAPLSSGTNSSLYPIQVHTVDGAVDTDCAIQRVYISGCRSTIVTGFSQSGSPGYTVENVYATGSTSAYQYPNPRQYFRAVQAGPPNSGFTSTSDCVFFDGFASEVEGWAIFTPGVPIGNFSQAFFTTSFTNPQSGPTGSGKLMMKTAGEYFVIESPYFIKGHSSFKDTAPLFQGGSTATANYLYEYDLDTGSGYSGTWKTATAANLISETISPAGFKIKVKCTCTVSSSAAYANEISFIKFFTNTSASDQANNLYPLSSANLAFTGLAPGSEVRCYTGSDPETAVLIGGIESTSGSTFSFDHSSGDQDGYITIFAMGFQPVRFNYTFKSSDDSIFIQPVVDRNYVNPA